MKTLYWLYLILIVTVLFRIGGIVYGLPLWVIGDEPSLVTGALKMLELKTVLPFLHIADLKATLYFPPYLSFLYMPFFAMLTGVKLLMFNGTFEAFKNYLISDLSAFFVLERLIHLVFSVSSVWLTYKIAKNVFKEERVALLSAAFLATSVIHIYSAFYHWGPAIFMMCLAFYYLTESSLSSEKRYLINAVIAGVAFGVNLIAGFIVLLAFFWYFLYEKNTFTGLLRDRSIWVGLLIFFLLAGLSIAVYPYGFHLSGDNSISQAKSPFGYFNSLIIFYGNVSLLEPVLFLSVFIGFYYSFKKERRYFWPIIAQLFFYATVFYFIFHYEIRFTSYMFPLLAITAGYGIHNILNRMFTPVTHRAIIVLIFSLPILACLQFVRLELKNDPRTMARNWAVKNIPAGSRVVTYAELLRFPANEEARQEQLALDPASLRQVDKGEAGEAFSASKKIAFHSLNLGTVNGRNVWKKMNQYINDHGYEYLVFDPYYSARNPENPEQLQQLAKNARLLATFGTPGLNIMGPGHFPDIITFLGLESLNPKIDIYKLK